MKTNVIFKSGLNLVCDEVSVMRDSSFLYIHNVTDSKRIELMNESLKNGWDCSSKDNCIHPNAVEIMLKNDVIKQFSIAS